MTEKIDLNEKRLFYLGHALSATKDNKKYEAKMGNDGNVDLFSKELLNEDLFVVYKGKTYRAGITTKNFDLIMLSVSTKDLTQEDLDIGFEFNHDFDEYTLDINKNQVEDAFVTRESIYDIIKEKTANKML